MVVPPSSTAPYVTFPWTEPLTEKKVRVGGDTGQRLVYILEHLLPTKLCFVVVGRECLGMRRTSGRCLKSNVVVYAALPRGGMVSAQVRCLARFNIHAPRSATLRHDASIQNVLRNEGGVHLGLRRRVPLYPTSNIPSTLRAEI